MDLLIITLRLVHILLGAVWVGTVVFNTFFLAPAIAEVGPDGGKIIGALQRRGMMTFLPLVALGTIVSGIWLLWKVSLGFNPVYFRSGAGHAFAGGGALAIVAYVIGIAVMRPAMLRAGALAQQMVQLSDEAERQARQRQIQGLRTRARNSGQVIVTLLILATAAMAVGRYL